MNAPKSIKSLLLLFAILFSLSASAYSAINKQLIGNAHCHKTVRLDLPGENASISDNILCEEQESEDDSDTIGSLHHLYLLTYSTQQAIPVLDLRHHPIETLVIAPLGPLFIYIRVIRI